MNHRLVARILGVMLLYMAAAQLLPLAVSLLTGDGAWRPLSVAIALTAVTGLLLAAVTGRGALFTIQRRDSFWITGLVWIVIPCAGALPILLTGTLPTAGDAIFESVSGFTTTGSSLINNPSLIPKSILLWRSMTQWIGGLGLIMFVIALLRRLGVASLQLYEAEFSGTLGRKLHPHIATAVSGMWRIYLLLTALLAVALLLCGERPLNSVCIALSTVSTGGFMPAQGGLATGGMAARIVLTVMMFLSGINIALLINMLRGKPRPLWRSREFRLYTIIYLCAALVTAATLTAAGNRWPEALSYSFFHIASTLSTCGFYLPHLAHWSIWASVITFLLLFIGPMAGSTGGGIKLKRIMILASAVRRYLTGMLHPQAVMSLTVDGDRIEPDYVSKVFAFVFLYIMLAIIGAFMLTFCGLSLPNALAMAAANISNLGPSPLLDSIGASIDYPALPAFGKWVLVVLMTAGRLEIFALLALLFPAYWKRR